MGEAWPALTALLAVVAAAVLALMSTLQHNAGWEWPPGSQTN